MTITSLRQIHGVGPSVEIKLLSHFGSEPEALNAIRNSQISEISSIDGIGERFALCLCRNLHYKETGEQIQDFLKTKDTIILYSHAYKNAIIPIMTAIGVRFANTVGASVVIEQIFAIPGVGRLVFQSVTTRDYPVVQGVVMVIAVIILLTNFLVDILYTVIDPRVRLD